MPGGPASTRSANADSGPSVLARQRGAHPSARSCEQNPRTPPPRAADAGSAREREDEPRRVQRLLPCWLDGDLGSRTIATGIPAVSGRGADCVGSRGALHRKQATQRVRGPRRRWCERRRQDAREDVRSSLASSSLVNTHRDRSSLAPGDGRRLSCPARRQGIGCSGRPGVRADGRSESAFVVAGSRSAAPRGCAAGL